MADVDLYAQALFAGLEMGVEGLDAGPFDETDQKPGGEDRRHDLECLKLRIQGRHQVTLRNHHAVLALQAGAQCGFHDENCSDIVMAPVCRRRYRRVAIPTARGNERNPSNQDK